MDKDTKVTFAVIGVLVVFLAGLAYFLRETVSIPAAKDKVAVVTTKPKVPVSNTGTKSATGTSQTTLATSTNATSTMNAPEKVTTAVFTTNKGVIEITFATNTPVTVKKFAELALKDFYNGTRFHRVIKDFMIQGGDPQSKDLSLQSRWGTGGPGYSFEDEFHPGDAFPQGTLAMANAGPNTNGSQFFIVTAPEGTPFLIGKHTVFGRVTKGMDIVLQIGNTATDGADRPIAEVVLEKVEVR